MLKNKIPIILILASLSCTKSNLNISTKIGTSNFEKKYIIPTDSIIYKNVKIGFFPTYTEEIMKQDYSWEMQYINYFTVIKTDSIWKMWYESYDPIGDIGDMGSNLCYAFSNDGKVWYKRLTNNPYNMNANNIIIPGRLDGGVHGPSVFIDKLNPEKPFRITFLRNNLTLKKVQLYTSLSRDGILWSTPKVILPDYYDSQNICFNSGNNWLFLLRGYVGTNRSISTIITDTIGNQLSHMRIISTSDESFGEYSHIYNSAATSLNDSTKIYFPTLFNQNNYTIKISLAIQYNQENLIFISKDITNIFSSNEIKKDWLIISPGLISTGENNIYWLYFYARDQKHSTPGLVVSTYYRVPIMIKLK